MSIKTISNAFTSKFGRQVLTTQKHMPAILFGAGVVGVVATVVLACRATLKLHDILDEAQEEMEKIATLELVNYSENERQRDGALLYFKTGSKIVLMYSPAIALGVVSIAALTGSHVILSRRNMALTAAYAALDKGFRAYRERVVNELGEDKDREFRYGSETKEVVEETPEGPKVVEVKKVGPDGASIYAKWFDDSCSEWQRQPEYNRLYLKCQQNYANDKLQQQGHLFLNEVYAMLNLKHTSPGSVVGWLKDPKPGEGDGYIDFGVFADHERNRDFINGWQDRVLLDFNVDGVIYDKI
jgi:hypothetical protein